MENKEQQILSEIKSMMASIRVQLERLDAKMAELQQIVDPEEFEAESIDLEIEDVQVKEEVLEEQRIPLADEPENDNRQPEPEVVPEPEIVQESQPVSVPEVVESPALPENVEDLPDDDLPFFEESAPVTVAQKAEITAKPTLNDAMAAQQAWRKDMPGTPVKDIRSAISLNDRILFINLLFREDPMSFQNALTRINQMDSIDQVVEFICSDYPEWDLNSEVTYRFMMAVRRKVR